MVSKMMRTSLIFCYSSQILESCDLNSHFLCEDGLGCLLNNYSNYHICFVPEPLGPVHTLRRLCGNSQCLIKSWLSKGKSLKLLRKHQKFLGNKNSKAFSCRKELS